MVNKCSGLSILKNELEAQGQLDVAGLVQFAHAECEKELALEMISSATLPPLWIRGWNFANAMARHAASGFTRCSNTTIEERLAVCQVCPHLVDHHCQLCGCACIADNQLMNKLALASETCPLGKWK